MKQLQQDNTALAHQQAQNNAAKQKEVSAIKETSKEEKDALQKGLNQLKNKEVQEQKAQYDSKINDTQKSLDDVNNSISDTENAIQDKQNEIKNLEAQDPSNSVMGSIVNSKLNGDTDPMVVDKIGAEKSSQALIEQNNALGNWADKNVGKEKIYNKQLTQEQAWQLNLYLMDRINATREAEGQEPFKVTKGAFDKVTERAQSAKNDFEHNMNDINAVFGEDWRGENLGWAGEMNDDEYNRDYANVVCSSLVNNMLMLNSDSSSGWGHRENFLMDYYKYGWQTPTQAAFAVVWSDKYDNWVLVFDAMAYDGGKDYANTLIQDYPKDNPNQDKIDALNNDISNLQSQLQDLNQKKHDLTQKLSDLNDLKDCVGFDYYHLNPQDKKSFDVMLKDKESVDGWENEKLSAIDSKYNKLNQDLQNEINTNNQKIKALENEIKEHQKTIAGLETQLKPVSPAKPAEKPVKPTDHSKQPAKPAEKPATTTDHSKQPVKPVEKPATTGHAEGTVQHHTDSMPSTNSSHSALNPSTSQPTEAYHSDVVLSNGHSYQPVVLPTHHTTVYMPTEDTTTDGLTMHSTKNQYHFVREAQAAELTPAAASHEQVASDKKPVALTRMERFHGQSLPQTGKDDQEVAAAGTALLALGSLFGFSMFRRRKHQN